MAVLSIDFETASQADLRKTGAARYARDPSTRVLCMAWAFDYEPVQIWTPNQPLPKRVVLHVANGGMVAGWNVSFEHEIWNNVVKFRGHTVYRLFPGQLLDTMARAAYWGLPMSLDTAGMALGCVQQKDKEGHKLMLRMCRPRKVHPDGTVDWWHETDADKFDALKAYCAQDVEVEREIARNLPPLPDAEQATWLADFRMNQNGVRLDRELIHRLQKIAQDETSRLDNRMRKITRSKAISTRSTTSILTCLRDAGYPHDNIQKATMLDRIGEATGLEAEILAVRLEAARSSTAKLTSMLACMDDQDDRARGLLQYYGATRTGRWAGRLIQPQNFPRGTVKGIGKAIDLIANHDVGPEELDALFTDTPMGVVASALRGCIIAPPGQLVVSCDLSQIEARMVAWLAGQEDVLEVFRRGEDIYTYQAEKQGSNDRQYGKVIVLACGFGMGPPKFQATAEGYGIFMSDDEARAAVYGYRDSNPRVVEFWHRCGEAAMAIAEGSKFEAVRHVEFRRRGQSMIVTLPSGRDLVYRGIRVVDDLRTGRPSVAYLGVDQKTRRWGLIRTYGGKLVENFTQAAARCVMRDAIVAVDQGEVPLLTPVLSIHDELIGYALRSYADQAFVDLTAVMSRTPHWAPGLPVAATGWVGPRYKKG